MAPACAPGGSLMRVRCSSRRSSSPSSVPRRPRSVPEAARRRVPPRLVSPAYERSLARILGSGRDVLGERLLRLPGGPTYAAAARLVPPLLFARTSKQRALTSSGVYYVPSAQPAGAQGAGRSDAAARRRQRGSVRLGRRAEPRASASPAASGSARACGARARRGWPRATCRSSSTSYVDAHGTRYRQEAFAARLPGGTTAAYVHVTRRPRSHRRRRGQAARALGAAAFTARAADRSLRVPARARSRRPLLAGRGSPRARRSRCRSRAWRRGARIADPEPDARPGATASATRTRSSRSPRASTCAGARRVRVRRRRAGDRAHVAHTPPVPYPAWKMGEKLLAAATAYRL